MKELLAVGASLIAEALVVMVSMLYLKGTMRERAYGERHDDGADHARAEVALLVRRNIVFRHFGACCFGDGKESMREWILLVS